jgi:hypothetical protein
MKRIIMRVVALAMLLVCLGGCFIVLDDDGFDRGRGRGRGHDDGGGRGGRR